ncbi:hypothetical protein [Moraxella bovis]|uniref:Uncharacterized protein n=1 Tax=Moraxella bovis TaxID=476 RepID=A0ABY6M9N1_MORBO|nr:hypothetical protein [Moraxella bovis]OOR91412.1 hypothetical protein B0182_02895 [Moraxella bovis]UYZ78103.1 hypothetical protein LP115_12825 [Moraxella bovis]UYZ79278.1 hypothetical protein LP115_05450 [Moraxella bovis]UYZ87758.1 hypothetical protein LP094_05455 [Moraxella bovis]UYZ96898.1 hypothetical protein LP107_08420 [Moraxella bovis]
MTNSILSHSLAVLTDEYHRYNAMHEQNPYMGYADRANAISNAIHALKQSTPKPKTALNRILGGAE